jgi:hypothetical protein
MTIVLSSDVHGLIIQNKPFNLEVVIPSVYETVFESEIHFTTKILNLAGENRMDISLNYEIINDNNQIVASKTETMAIETQASFVGTLNIPEDVKNGDYKLHVILLVNGTEEAEGTNSFKIKRRGDNTYYYIYAILISLVFLLLVFYLIFKSKNILKNIQIKRKIRRMIKKKLGKLN